jgi:PKD repeat protein
MKIQKIIITVTLIACTKLVMAFPFTVQGYVTDELGQAVPNHPVETLSLYWAGVESSYTDTNGFYQIYFPNLNGSAANLMFVRTWSYCDGIVVDYIEEIDPSPSSTAIVNFSICNPTMINQDCIADFFPIQSSSSNNAFFINLSMGNIDSVRWDFGDGTTTGIFHPAYHYKHDGIYDVKLTIYADGGSCENSYTSEILIGHWDYMSGEVNVSGLGLPEGKIYMFYDEPGLSGPLVYSSEVFDGEFIVPYFHFGFTKCLAIPEFDINGNYYPKYIPTYYGNSENWEDATGLNPQQPGFSFDIELIKYEEINYGDCSISGSVIRNDLEINFEDSSNSLHGTLPFIVYLKNSEDEIMDFHISENSGGFTFDNLPVGNYSLCSEIFGIPSVCKAISVSESQSVTSETEFIVGIQSVFLDINIDNIPGESIRIFPNPVQDLLRISTTAYGSKMAELFTIDGKLQFVTEFTQSDLQIDMSRFARGLYIMKLSNSDGSVHLSKLEKI